MDIMERTIISFDDVREGVAEILQDLSFLRSNALIGDLLRSDELNKIKQWEDTLQAHADEAFTVVILGDFKRGKSTLINALLGQNVAPMDVSPETVTINRILYGTERRREAVLENGKRIRLGEGELTRDSLQQIMERLPSPIRHIDIFEDNALLKEIVIVDTPGLNDLLNVHDQGVREYLINADAVIYVASVLSPLSESEQAVLAASVMPQGFSKLFVVANMADCFDTTEDVDRVRSEIANRVSAFAPNAAVYALSALDEYCKKRGDARHSDFPEYLEAAFQRFLEDIQNEMILKKDMIKAQRLITLAQSMSADIRKWLAVTESMLTASREKLDGLSQKYEEENVNLHNTIAGHVDKLKEEIANLSFTAKEWIRGFLLRLRAEVENARKTSDTVTIQKHFHFYLTDMTKASILSCINAHRPVVEELVKNMAKNYTESVLFDPEDIQLPTIAADIADISWTAVDTAAFMFHGQYVPGMVDANGMPIRVSGLGLMGLSSPLGGLSFIVSLAGEAAMGFVRENKLKKKQQDLLKPLLENFSAIETIIYDNMTMTYEKLAENAAQKLTALFETELFHSQNAVKNAIDILDNHNIESETVHKEIQKAYKIMDAVDAVISRFC